MFETIVDYNDHNNASLSNDKLRQAFSKFMAETEVEEHISKRNTNNVTINIFSNQYPVMANTQE